MAEKKVRIDLNGTDPGKSHTTDYDQSPDPNQPVLLFPDATVDIQHGGHLNELTIKLHHWTPTESLSLTGTAASYAAAHGIDVDIHDGVITLTHPGGGSPSETDWETVLHGIQFTDSQDVPDGTHQRVSISTTSHVDLHTGHDRIEVTCFYVGTMVATPAGEVAVETLKRGDLVLTIDGRALPVTWLGRQTISRLFTDPLRALPIRIKAGALAASVPTRDLLVSPDHALLVDSALIQAGALVNGTSIVREYRVPINLTYYHVELDEHALILAENAPAESFVDNVDRLRFDNWAEHAELYPDGKQVKELPYPRAKSQRQVPVNVRVKLAERASLIGAALDSVSAA